MNQTALLVKPSALALSMLCCAISLLGCASFAQQQNPEASDNSINAVADEHSQEHRRIKRHIYAGIGAGPSWMQPDTSEVLGADVNQRVDSGRQVTLGIDLSRQVAIELHSVDLGSAGVTPNNRVNYKINGISALMYAGKNRHNFRRYGLSGYARLGLGVLDNSIDGDATYVQENATHFLIGAGLEYMTRFGLGVRAEGILFEEDARYAQLALVYRTGDRRGEKPVELVQAAVSTPIIPPVLAAADKPLPTPSPVAVPAVVVAQKPILDSSCSEFRGTLEGVNFLTNSAKLTQGATVRLDAVAARLNDCVSVPVRISSHTDSVGDDAYNHTLSAQRAKSVARYLIKQGVAAARLRARALGETRPIDTNETDEGRSRNRRVELSTEQ